MKNENDAKPALGLPRGAQMQIRFGHRCGPSGPWPGRERGDRCGTACPDHEDRHTVGRMGIGGYYPPEPAALCGQFNLRISKRVNDPLTATALAIEARDETAVLDQA